MEIHNEMVNALGDDVSSRTMVYNWAFKIKSSYMSTKNDSCSRHPKSATTLDIITQIHTVLEDHQLRMDGIAEVTDISHESVHDISTQELDIEKFCGS